MVKFVILWNFTNICPLLLKEICLDIYATRHERCTCFWKKICQCWSEKYNMICKNDDKWSCSFSIDIFCCKNKCIGHVSLRRYPSISPSKAEDKYSWSCMFVIFSTLTCSDVPWLITFSLLKILKLLARLGLEIGFGNLEIVTKTKPGIGKTNTNTNPRICIRNWYSP